MKFYSGLFMHTFAIVVRWKFTVAKMRGDTELWDAWVQSNILTGVYGGYSIHFKTCSREVLVSYIISKVTANGVYVSFKDAKTEGSLLLEFLKQGSRVPYLWAIVGAFDGKKCWVCTYDDGTVSEVLKQGTQFACGVCSKDIFL